MSKWKRVGAMCADAMGCFCLILWLTLLCALAACISEAVKGRIDSRKPAHERASEFGTADLSEVVR
jgi:hypothetical protein